MPPPYRGAKLAAKLKLAQHHPFELTTKSPSMQNQPSERTACPPCRPNWRFKGGVLPREEIEDGKMRWVFFLLYDDKSGYKSKMSYKIAKELYISQRKK